MVRGGEGRNGMPSWLSGLVEESFFVKCKAHGNKKKNERNIFCLDCCTSFCPHCLPSHPSHPLLQVRRSVYNDVVHLDDLQKLIDCSYVQSYIVNNAKAIFLKPRPQSKPSKGSENSCTTCNRTLQEPFDFCSLSCKVKHVLSIDKDLSTILFRFNRSDFTLSHFQSSQMDCTDLNKGDGQNTPISTLENPLQDKGSSSASTSDKKSLRRKGVPRRSPLF